MSDGVNVRGADNLARTMGGARRDIAEMSAANRAAGELLAGRARTAAPHRTGQLARSITVTSSGSTATVAATAPYAAVINFGSRRRHIAPRPFMTSQTSATAAWAPLYARELTRALAQVKGI